MSKRKIIFLFGVKRGGGLGVCVCACTDAPFLNLGKDAVSGQMYLPATWRYEIKPTYCYISLEFTSARAR
jgi:hypothetical protein